MYSGFFEEDENGEELTFESFGQEQADATFVALLDLEDRFYAEFKDPPSEIQQVNVQNEYDNFRRYDYGYSAHVDEISNEEILLWKRNFPYLRVEGNFISDKAVPCNRETNLPSYDEEVLYQHIIG